MMSEWCGSACCRSTQMPHVMLPGGCATRTLSRNDRAVNVTVWFLQAPAPSKRAGSSAGGPAPKRPRGKSKPPPGKSKLSIGGHAQQHLLPPSVSAAAQAFAALHAMPMPVRVILSYCCATYQFSPPQVVEHICLQTSCKCDCPNAGRCWDRCMPDNKLLSYVCRGSTSHRR